MRNRGHNIGNHGKRSRVRIWGAQGNQSGVILTTFNSLDHGCSSLLRWGFSTLSTQEGQTCPSRGHSPRQRATQASLSNFIQRHTCILAAYLLMSHNNQSYRLI